MSALHSRGLFPIDVAEDTARRSRSMSATEVALGLGSLAAMLNSGIPLDRALAAFEEVASPAWQVALSDVRARVSQGETLAGALEGSHVGVPALQIGVIRAGETGGSLAAAVARAAELAESTAQLRRAIASALAYPTLLAIVGGASVAVVTGVVLPRLAALLEDAGAATPMLARWAIGAAGASRFAGPVAIALVVLAIVAWRWMQGDGERTRILHEFLLSIPLVRELRHASASSRICAALASTLESGVNVAEALSLAASAGGDFSVGARVLEARRDVQSGVRLWSALHARAAVTPTAVRLVRVGEESGTLAVMLTRAARLDAEMLAARIGLMIRLLEPTMIVAFAGVVALVAAALLQAVYAIRPT